MTPEGAKAVAKSLADTSANPPVHAVVHTNGAGHESVVHVTFGQPKPIEKIGEKAQVLKVTTPKRPRPFTLS